MKKYKLLRIMLLIVTASISIAAIAAFAVWEKWIIVFGAVLLTFTGWWLIDEAEAWGKRKK